jgi:TetR/AcrR family transcriptional repressor of nem operon
MKQRKKQPQLTRRTILESAGAEFSLHGYAGTGLGAVVTRAELTKGALFHHFSDKRAMAVAWINDLLGPQMEARWMTPLESIGSLEALKVFCRARCMELAPDDATSALVSLTAETAASDSMLGGALEQIFEQWRGAIAALLERGKSEGWIHRSIQPAAEAAFVVSAFAGFTVTTRAHPDEGIRRVCASALEGYLETLRAE